MWARSQASVPWRRMRPGGSAIAARLPIVAIVPLSWNRNGWVGLPSARRPICRATG